MQDKSVVESLAQSVVLLETGVRRDAYSCFQRTPVMTGLFHQLLEDFHPRHRTWTLAMSCSYFSNWIWSTLKLLLPLKGEKLKPQTCVRLKPSFGAPDGCQSVRRENELHGTVMRCQPPVLSVNVNAKRSAVSVVVPAAWLSRTSTRIGLPLAVPLNQKSKEA